MTTTGIGREQLRQVSSLHHRSLRGWSRDTGPRNRWRVLAPTIGLGAAALMLRLVEAASGPTDWDGAQYVLGVWHFDVAYGTPSPPATGSMSRSGTPFT